MLAATKADPGPSWLPALLFAVLALIWGSSFLLMKRGLAVFAPTQVAALRLAIAALWLVPLVWRDRRELPPIAWRLIVLAGLFGNGIPALLFATAQTKLDSASAGVLNSVSPVFTLLGAALFWGERVPWQRAVGIVLGLGGAVVLIVARANSSLAFDPLYAGLIVLASACYAVSTNLIRYHLGHLRALHLAGLAIGTVGLPAGLWLVLDGIFGSGALGKAMAQPGAWAALGYIAILGTLGTAMSVVLFTRLLQLVGSAAASVTYLIPVVALAWGVLDGEPVGLPHLLGFATILGGVWLANRQPRPGTALA